MWIQFANSFFSYLVVFFVFVVVGGIAIALGITARKIKNNKNDEIKKQDEQKEIA